MHLSDDTKISMKDFPNLQKSDQLITTFKSLEEVFSDFSVTFRSENTPTSGWGVSVELASGDLHYPFNVRLPVSGSLVVCPRHMVSRSFCVWWSSHRLLGKWRAAWRRPWAIFVFHLICLCLPWASCPPSSLNSSAQRRDVHGVRAVPHQKHLKIKTRFWILWWIWYETDSC